MKRGRFIALEGGEGAGKSTQLRLLADLLGERGIETVTTREPGGTPGAEAIRALLLATDGEGWHPRAEALLFAAARSDHVERRIEPALASGRWVLCDRYLDSSRAYQGAGGGLDDADVLTLHHIGSSGLMPDLTVLLDVSAAKAQERLASRGSAGLDRIEGKGADYHARVGAAFRNLASAEPDRFAVIDADQTVDVVHDRIAAAVLRLLVAD